jgi:hypothetical protein
MSNNLPLATQAVYLCTQCSVTERLLKLLSHQSAYLS